MARKAILDTYYTFIPSTRTVIIPHAVQKERLVLITDLTTNQVLYNFSDPNLTTTSYAVATDSTGANTTTTLTLNYNTSGLSSTDKLQIVVDEYAETFQPAETYLDPINKLRTSSPQSLIDTDYEYSTQTTKWEQLGMVNNQPYAYYVTATGNLGVINVTANNGSRVYTANTGSTTPPAVGTPVVILDTIYSGADGLYVVDSNNVVTGANTFNYTGKYFFTGTNNFSIFNNGVTIGYQGFTFSNAAISMAAANAVGNIVTVTTANGHGLSVGNEIALTGANTANGSWAVSTVVSPNTFQFYTQTLTPGQGALTLTTANLYVRPQGLAVHRSFDGGVRFSTNASSHNQQYIRQTRRYFRYQSGKGIQMSTGTVLKSQFNLDGITSNNSTLCTVITKDPHNIFATMNVAVSGANETAYNGTFQVVNVVDPYRFQYLANTVPAANIASGPIYGSAQNWYGGTNRIGIFDSQNGLFWEYDGQGLYAVKRNSTYQISGQVVVTPGSTIVTASTLYPTYFNKQLAVNDFIVIKGMSYRVVNINSDTNMQIQPAYRGTVLSNNAVVSRTVDLRIPVSSFNIDRLDGTGPSGYNIDLTKMQMFYIDYSWYGAGFIRFGVRGPDGNVIYCHKIINNNVNYLAYMRSGNLPGRYETNTFSKTTYMTGGAAGLGSNLFPTDSTIYVGSTAGFPNTGTIWVRNGYGGAGAVASEYINYTGLTSNSFTGLIRGQAGNTAIYANTVSGNNILTVVSGNGTTGIQVGQLVYGPNVASQSYIQSFVPNTSITLNNSTYGNTSYGQYVFMPMANVAQTFTYSATAQTAVELHAPQFSPEINHWGTSAIMDGGFTNDKSFIFTKGMTTTIPVTQGASQAVMSFRISPSASNGIAGPALGVREIINRMQQLPFETDLYANGSFLITCVLNGTTSNTAENWVNVGGSSLSQYIFHNPGTTLISGEPVFGFYLNTAQGTYATTQQDLTQLLALGTSIVGGGTANSAVGVYPNGPDVLTFVAQNIDTATRVIQARYSWNEAQA
jgi:hypothetical protein